MLTGLIVSLRPSEIERKMALIFNTKGTKVTKARWHPNRLVPTLGYLRCLRFLLFKEDASFGSSHPSSDFGFRPSDFGLRTCLHFGSNTYAIKSATSCGLRPASNPSGINERPELLSSFRLFRRMTSSLPPAVFSEILFGVSAIRIPL